MLFPILLILTIATRAMSIPYSNPLQSPSVLQLAQSANTTTTQTSLGDWPQVPYNVHVGRISITFQRYGRTAQPNARSTVIKAFDMLRNHFNSNPQKAYGRSIMMTSGIVRFSVHFILQQQMTGEEIANVLLVLRLSYSEPSWTLHEIANGEIDSTIPNFKAIALFQVTFIEV